MSNTFISLNEIASAKIGEGDFIEIILKSGIKTSVHMGDDNYHNLKKILEVQIREVNKLWVPKEDPEMED